MISNKLKISISLLHKEKNKSLTSTKFAKKLFFLGSTDITIFRAVQTAIAAAIKYTVGEKAYGYSGLGDIFVFIFFFFLSHFLQIS